MFKYLLNPLPREKDTKFEQSQGDRGLGISICLGCHIIEPFSKVNVLTKQKQRKREYNVADNWKFFRVENMRSLQAVLKPFFFVKWNSGAELFKAQLS